MKPLIISPIALGNEIVDLKNVFCDLSEDLDKINSPNPFLIKEDSETHCTPRESTLPSRHLLPFLESKGM